MRSAQGGQKNVRKGRHKKVRKDRDKEVRKRSGKEGQGKKGRRRGSEEKVNLRKPGQNGHNRYINKEVRTTMSQEKGQDIHLIPKWPPRGKKKMAQVERKRSHMGQVLFSYCCYNKKCRHTSNFLRITWMTSSLASKS